MRLETVVLGSVEVVVAVVGLGIAAVVGYGVRYWQDGQAEESRRKDMRQSAARYQDTLLQTIQRAERTGRTVIVHKS